MRVNVTYQRKSLNWLYRFAITLAIVLLLTTLLTGESAARQEYLNKVVVMIDGSKSYQSRQMEAINRAVSLIEAMSQKELHRWEKDTDIVTIVSLDAIPEVIWSGASQTLRELGTDLWTKQFKARTDYANCTDVCAAFRLAVKLLDGDSGYVSKYMFVFSDLVDEPPTDSIYKPARSSKLPSGDFPWEKLRNVSVSAFWVPADSKLLWRRELEKHSLESSFQIYTTSESGEVDIKPPPKPEKKLTEAEREAARQRYIGYAKRAAAVIGIAFIVIFLALAIIAVLVQGNRQGRDGPPGRRPGTVRRRLFARNRG